MCLSMELVTAVLGDHGQRPRDDYGRVFLTNFSTKNFLEVQPIRSRSYTDGKVVHFKVTASFKF